LSPNTITNGMKRLIYILFISIFPFCTQAQDTTQVEEEFVSIHPIFYHPEFPGGMSAFYQYLKDSIRYPKSALEKEKAGRAICMFTICKDGSITDVEVVRTSGDSALDAEAVRVLQAMPKWKPEETYNREGKRVAIATKYTAPVQFVLPSWHTITDTVSLVDKMDTILMPNISINSVWEKNRGLYCSVSARTRLSHYGLQMGKDYSFEIFPNVNNPWAYKAEIEKPNVPREGIIPLTATDKWNINYMDMGEWGNYLSFSNDSTGYFFNQYGNLRALFKEDSTFLAVSQSTIARIHPSSGRLMTIPKTDEDFFNDLDNYEMGGAKPEILWTTDPFRIYMGEADTIISGAYKIDDKLMLAMQVGIKRGIWSFDGKDFHWERDLVGIRFDDDYSTLLNQQTRPDVLLLPFHESKDKKGILRIEGRAVRLIYLLFPERTLPVTRKDPTVSMIQAMQAIPNLTMAEVDSIEHLYGGVALDDEQYYTLLPDKSYIWRYYETNETTGRVESVQFKRNDFDYSNRDYSKWQNSVFSAFQSELTPAKSLNSNFKKFTSPRFNLSISVSSRNMIDISFPTVQ